MMSAQLNAAQFSINTDNAVSPRPTAISFETIASQPGPKLFRKVLFGKRRTGRAPLDQARSSGRRGTMSLAVKICTASLF
jgi:hypothetical protein